MKLRGAYNNEYAVQNFYFSFKLYIIKTRQGLKALGINSNYMKFNSLNK